MKPKLVDADAGEPMVTLIIPPGANLLTEDHYWVVTAHPISLRVPASALHNADETEPAA